MTPALAVSLPLAAAAVVAWAYSGFHALIWLWWIVRHGENRQTYGKRALFGGAIFMGIVALAAAISMTARG